MLSSASLPERQSSSIASSGSSPKHNKIHRKTPALKSRGLFRFCLGLLLAVDAAVDIGSLVGQLKDLRQLLLNFADALGVLADEIVCGQELAIARETVALVK